MLKTATTVFISRILTGMPVLARLMGMPHERKTTTPASKNISTAKRTA